MDPCRASLHALRAFTSLWGFDGRDRIDMRAVSVGNHPLPLLLKHAMDERDGNRAFADRRHASGRRRR